MYFGGVVMGEEAVYGVLFRPFHPQCRLSILYNLTIGGNLCGIFFCTGQGLLINILLKSARLVAKGFLTQLH